jgi:hypothetical protein
MKEHYILFWYYGIDKKVEPDMPSLSLAKLI